MVKLFVLVGAMICAVWALASCGKTEPDRFAIVGPMVYPLMQPIHQDVDLVEPPDTARPPRWNPGDPTINPGDIKASMAVAVAGESWFSGLLRRICCAIFSCEPEPPKPPDKSYDPTKVTEGADFEGIPGTGYEVPDPVGDIGPNHYVQAVNSAFQVFGTAGNPLTNALLIKHLWDGTDSPCKLADPIDPIVRYDKQADRWLISGFITPFSGEHMCVAISQTPDPTNPLWFLYDFKAVDPSSNKPFSIDFPKLSVWPDAYYLSTVEGFNLGLDVWALERSKMLMGQPAGIVRFQVSNPGIALLPGDPDGLPPPDGSPAWFARQMDDGRVGNGGDRVEVFRFSVDWSNPSGSTFVKQDVLPVDEFDSILCSTEILDTCVPQPGTPQLLETLSTWPQWRLVYRNMGDHETLLFNHTIDTDGQGHAGIRWYELRRPPDGSWAVYQQGTHQDQDLNYFMGSISMDRDGNIALGYTASSSTVFPGIHIAHRMANDAPGSMPGAEYVAVSGSGSQAFDNPRWGNYSTMDVDPDNDCTFWYTHEYYEVTSLAGWRTRVLSFSLPGCVQSASY